MTGIDSALRAPLRGGSLHRRRFVSLAASAGLVSTVAPLTARPASSEPDLEVFTWSGYELPEFHRAFIDKHGGSPSFTFLAELEEALQKLRAGYQADLGHSCVAAINKWTDAGLLEPIDTSRLPQWDNVFASMREARGVPAGDGQVWMVPWDWGNSSILYRTDIVDIEEESFGLYLDERYKGKMAFFDSADAFAQVTGAIIGAADPLDMTDEEFERARETMRRIQENLRFYWSDPTEIEQALASGEIVLAYAWNGSATALSQQGVPIRFMNPKEGIWTWVCGLSLLKDGPGSTDQAYDFLNAFLDPVSGKNLIELYGYGHSNAKAFELVAPERLAELGISDPVAMMANARISLPMPPEFRERVIEAFDEIKAGM